MIKSNPGHSLAVLLGLLLAFLGAVAGTASGASGVAATSGVNGRYRNTYYYSVQESDFKGQPQTEEMRDMNEKVVARVSKGFMKEISIEGSGRLLDGRIINFQGRKEGVARWTTTRHEFGRGVGDCPLIPFHTIAVDPERIPLGSVVYIPGTEGMRLPDGSIHDGVWRAEDIGSAILKDRMDLFVGDGDQGRILEAYGITSLMPLTVKLIEETTSASCVNQPPSLTD
ncbi:MAG: hypothetical protein H7222_02005 [Methylotenera sp.]|nr:hypothetical protein [Oligoflexia bacterium]